MRLPPSSILPVLFSLVAACGASSPDVSNEIGHTPRPNQTTVADAGASASPDPNGAGATSDAGGAPPSSTGAPSCDGLAVCDDFEADAVGAAPGGWTVTTPNCSGTGAITVDGSQAHSGARSVKVTGGGGYCNHVFLATTAAANVGASLWGRFFVRLDQALGDNHVTFVSMKNASDGKELRIGGQNKVLMWNRESDDATLPAMSPAGAAKSTPLTPAAWRCVELRIDGENGAIQTWVDGVAIEGLAVDQTPTPDVDEPWLRKTGWLPMPTDFKLGWESYGDQTMTLWFDDVALGAHRIGCGG